MLDVLATIRTHARNTVDPPGSRSLILLDASHAAKKKERTGGMAEALAPLLTLSPLLNAELAQVQGASPAPESVSGATRT